MTIQVFLPKFRTDECLAEIKECLEKGWTGMGHKTQLFEEKWREYTKLPHAHFLNSNTVGLHLAFNLLKRAYRWHDGDEVITTPLTFVSTNHAICYENLQPVFADVDDTLCLDPESIETRITKKTRAVIYVGFGGNTGRLEEVSALCKHYNIKLILDAAHMAGTRYKNKHIGDQADITVFSFQAVKNLPTADSGMICCQEEEWDREVRKSTWLGINKDTFSRTTSAGNYKWHYDVETVGFKYHGNSIMASLGLVALRYLDEDNKRRREMAALYESLLANLPNVKFVKKVSGCESAQHLFQIRVPQRDHLIEYLHENKVYPGVHYRDNTEYAMYNYGKDTCPNAQKISNEVITLPLHLHLTQSHIEHIVKLIKTYYGM